MEPSLDDSIRLVRNSQLYKEFLAERHEILCHKWIESEKVGCDIGFERALFDWIVKYRSAWLDERLRSVNPGTCERRNSRVDRLS